MVRLVMLQDVTDNDHSPTEDSISGQHSICWGDRCLSVGPRSGVVNNNQRRLCHGYCFSALLFASIFGAQLVNCECASLSKGAS
jgi:hypothetical protein